MFSQSVARLVIYLSLSVLARSVMQWDLIIALLALMRKNAE